MPSESEEKNAGNEVDSGANGETVPASGAAESEPGSGAAPADPIAEARAEAAKMKEQWMRTAADFDNFRKRSRRELEDVRKAGKEELLKEFLPVFDNLERAIQSAQRATDVKGVAEGLSMVLRQYVDTLARGGIVKVPSVGNQFDPAHHEAIQQVETDEHPPGTVVAEVQPGYQQGERLIRAAMVVVAKPPQKKSDSDAKDSEGGNS
jgi:molecular chaperone GrpE